ncbi:hypothetical protein BDV97DRAFT_403106 [Delphinella strobiligena]|nr:hypothetical protein BDV97DRAFT_403106 [Delphinella strobiligena]
MANAPHVTSPADGHHALGEAEFSHIPPTARVATSLISFISTSILIYCLTRRIQCIDSFKKAKAATWLLLATYVDSLVFIVSSAVLSKNFALDHSAGFCDSAILICIMFFFSSKIIMYAFFNEKVRIVRNPTTPRLKDRLYMFNTIVVLGIYVGLVILLFLYRLYMIRAGRCYIGIKRPVLVPALLFDGFVNVYLTALFIDPIRKLYSYSGNKSNIDGSAGNPALRNMAVRTMIGSITSLVATVINIITLAALLKENAWVCFLMCNIDVSICVISIHFATSRDHKPTPVPVDENALPRRSYEPNRYYASPSTLGRSFLGISDDMSDFSSSSPQHAIITTSCTPGSKVKAVHIEGISRMEHMEIRTEDIKGSGDP